MAVSRSRESAGPPGTGSSWWRRTPCGDRKHTWQTPAPVLFLQVPDRRSEVVDPVTELERNHAIQYPLSGDAGAGHGPGNGQEPPVAGGQHQPIRVGGGYLISQLTDRVRDPLQVLAHAVLRRAWATSAHPVVVHRIHRSAWPVSAAPEKQLAGDRWHVRKWRLAPRSGTPPSESHSRPAGALVTEDI